MMFSSPLSPLRLRPLAVFAPALLALLACTPAPAEKRTDMIFGVTEDVETLNEVISLGGSFNLSVIRQLFLGLADELPDFQTKPLEFVPRLATEWEFSEDRLQLTFKLRDDVQWTDGTPLTAEDVRFTWQAHTHPDTAYSYAFVKELITDVEVVDPHTVRFHYSGTNGTQFMDAIEGVILPKHVWGQLPFEEWRKQPNWFTDNLVTSGPYTIRNWRRGESFELIANPVYYETGLPKIERVLFRHVSETSSLFAQLLSGDLDFIQTMRPADVATAQARDDLKVFTHANRQFTFVSWNSKIPFFQDIEVRRALTLGIDRAAMLDTIWLGYANPGSTPILSSTWGAHPDLEPLPYDPERAAELLDASGWVDTDGDGVRDKGGVEFSFELWVNTGNPLRWDAAQMIQSDLAQLGIEARPTRLDFQTVNARTQARDYESAIIGLMIDTTLDNSFILSEASVGNFGGYRNDEIEDLLVRYAEALDKFSEVETLHRIQEIVHDEQPMTVLWEPLGIRGMSADLLDATPSSSSDLWRLRHWEWSSD